MEYLHEVNHEISHDNPNPEKWSTEMLPYSDSENVPPGNGLNVYGSVFCVHLAVTKVSAWSLASFTEAQCWILMVTFSASFTGRCRAS